MIAPSSCLVSKRIFCFLSLLSLVVASPWHDTLLRGSRLSAEDVSDLAKTVELHVRNAASKLALVPTTSDVCPVCSDKDYSEICPNGWRFSETEGTCSAPSSYVGLCSSNLFLFGRPAVDKKEIELTCSVCWPCRIQTNVPNSSCTRDWAAECPNGYMPSTMNWDDYGDALPKCVATPLYEGTCENDVVFRDLHEKQLFSERCATTWPCADVCGDNTIMGVCPTEWTHIGKRLCVAPNHYKRAGCPLVKSFRGWSSNMKMSFAEQCDVRWDCTAAEASSAIGDGVGSCDSIDSSSCPLGWMMDGSLCIPAAEGKGPCDSAMDFAGWSEEEKLYWSSNCVDLEWPCSGTAA